MKKELLDYLEERRQVAYKVIDDNIEDFQVVQIEQAIIDTLDLIEIKINQLSSKEHE